MNNFRLLTIFITVISMFAGLSASVTAQDAESEVISQPGVPILNFDVENLGPILNEMEYLWQARQSPDGRPFILVNAQGETVFVLSPLACRGNAFTDCVGLQFISVFEGEADLSQVRAFNNRYPVANLGVNEIGNAYLNRYDIADYGIARGNVATLISTFATLSQIYRDTVNGEGDVISHNTEAPTQAVAVAQRVLDETSSEALRAVPIASIRAQESGRNLDAVFADEALPKNKVQNIGQ